MRLPFLILASGLFVLTAQRPEPPAIFTPAQAEKGRIAYDNTCGQCHTPTLLGRNGSPGKLPPLAALSDEYRNFIGPRGWVPPLAGKTFLDRWGSKTAAQLIARFQETVDYFKVEGADPDFTVNVTAYILQVNGAKAGTRPLTRATETVVASATH